LEDAAQPFDGTYVVQTALGRVNAVDGYKATRALFRRHPHLSLLFCGNDRLAMGAYDYLKETGRQIPRDVAIVGFDNQWLIATQIRPALTTVALPHYEIGKRSVALALGHLDASGPQQAALPCELITRKST
jgi:LacI family transcriptional regulator